MLARSKFLSTLPELLEVDRHFAHALDETLTFARSLRSIGYATVQQKFCEMFSVPEVLKAWLQMEKSRKRKILPMTQSGILFLCIFSVADERVTAFLSSETAFKNRYEEGAENPEDLKVAEGAEHFVTMLKAITGK